MVLSIAYTLYQPGQKYERLAAAIKSTSGSWCRVSESYWLIEIDQTPLQVVNFLLAQGVVDKDDLVLVAQISAPAYGGTVSQDRLNWMNSAAY